MRRRPNPLLEVTFPCDLRLSPRQVQVRLRNLSPDQVIHFKLKAAISKSPLLFASPNPGSVRPKSVTNVIVTIRDDGAVCQGLVVAGRAQVVVLSLTANPAVGSAELSKCPFRYIDVFFLTLPGHQLDVPKRQSFCRLQLRRQRPLPETSGTPRNTPRIILFSRASVWFTLLVLVVAVLYYSMSIAEELAWLLSILLEDPDVGSAEDNELPLLSTSSSLTCVAVMVVVLACLMSKARLLSPRILIIAFGLVACGVILSNIGALL